MPINPHARFFSLLNQLPGADKEDFVWHYSHMLTNSLSEFHAKCPRQYAEMVSDMQKMVDDRKNGAEKANIAELKRLRSAILHRLQKHGIDTTDYDKVNAFMLQPRIAGKTLGQMSVKEMKDLIPKMESILLKDNIKRIETNRMTESN